MSVLSVDGIGIDFGGITAVDAVSFEVRAGEIVSIIGPNGAGKTTCFNLISGLYVPMRGTVRLLGDEVTALAPHELARRGLSRTFQNLQVFQQMSAVENVMAGHHLAEGRHVLADLLGLPSSRRRNRRTLDSAMQLLERVGLAQIAQRDAGALSYGQLKRLEIARALACGPKVLLLDEPAAGCNAVETEEIDGLIHDIAHRDGIAVLLVEHDMKLVMKISNHIVVLDHGRKLADGPPTAIRDNPAVIEAYLGTHGAQQALAGGSHALG